MKFILESINKAIDHFISINNWVGDSFYEKLPVDEQLKHLEPNQQFNYGEFSRVLVELLNLDVITDFRYDEIHNLIREYFKNLDMIKLSKEMDANAYDLLFKCMFEKLESDYNIEYFPQFICLVSSINYLQNRFTVNEHFILIFKWIIEKAVSNKKNDQIIENASLQDLNFLSI